MEYLTIHDAIKHEDDRLLTENHNIISACFHHSNNSDDSNIVVIYIDEDDLGTYLGIKKRNKDGIYLNEYSIRIEGTFVGCRNIRTFSDADDNIHVFMILVDVEPILYYIFIDKSNIPTVVSPVRINIEYNNIKFNKFSISRLNPNNLCLHLFGQYINKDDVFNIKLGYPINAVDLKTFYLKDTNSITLHDNPIYFNNLNINADIKEMNLYDIAIRKFFVALRETKAVSDINVAINPYKDNAILIEHPINIDKNSSVLLEVDSNSTIEDVNIVAFDNKISIVNLLYIRTNGNNRILNPSSILRYKYMIFDKSII